MTKPYFSFRWHHYQNLSIPGKRKNKKSLSQFLDDVIAIIANDQFLGFYYKRKDILSELQFSKEHFFLVIVLTMSFTATFLCIVFSHEYSLKFLVLMLTINCLLASYKLFLVYSGMSELFYGRPWCCEMNLE